MKAIGGDVLYIDSLKKGDMFFNPCKDHIGTVSKVTKKHIYYTWKGITEQYVNKVEIGKVCKVEKSVAKEYAKKWQLLTGLEKELY